MEQLYDAVLGVIRDGFTLSDLDRSVTWYERVFGFAKGMEDKRPDGTGYFVLLGSADFAVLVGLFVHPSNDKERSSEARTGLDHVGSTVASHLELEEWEARLTELDIEHSPSTTSRATLSSSSATPTTSSSSSSPRADVGCGPNAASDIR
jgi:catechol-2,3-dioxygenase